MEITIFTATFRPLYCSSSETHLPGKKWSSRWHKVHAHRFVSKRYSKHLVLKCQSQELPVIEAGCMEEIYDNLAQRLVPIAAAESSPNFKHIVGLAGPPGAGKSTVAFQVASRVNKLWPGKSACLDSQVESPEVAIVLPMDGFHLYRHQLDAMKDPKEAHARRGSPWTFDPERLLACLTCLRNQGSVYAPSFDHGVGDPVEDDIFVSLQHKIVIVEGNYLLLDEDIWRDIAGIFNEKWFIDVEVEKAMQRVLKRHVSTGKSPELAKWRIDYNDRPNTELIMKTKNRADLIIKSIDSSQGAPKSTIKICISTTTKVDSSLTTKRKQKQISCKGED